MLVTGVNWLTWLVFDVVACCFSFTPTMTRLLFWNFLGCWARGVRCVMRGNHADILAKLRWAGVDRDDGEAEGAYECGSGCVGTIR